MGKPKAKPNNKDQTVVNNDDGSKPAPIMTHCQHCVVPVKKFKSYEEYAKAIATGINEGTIIVKENGDIFFGDGKRLSFPDGIWVRDTPQGVRLVIVDGSLQFLNTIVDKVDGYISKELSNFLLEQANALKAIARSYELIALAKREMPFNPDKYGINPAEIAGGQSPTAEPDETE